MTPDRRSVPHHVTVDLRLVRKRPFESRDAHWQPFDLNNTDFDLSWWHQIIITDDDSFLEARMTDAEVARVHLDETVYIDHYMDVPELGSLALEIQFIEVAASMRNQGIGRRVVDLTAALYPNRRLVAFSEGADGFWESLGWRRFEHADGVLHRRPLYIQTLA